MLKIRTILFIICLSCFQNFYSQTEIESKLSKYVNALAHDSLEGRATGSKSEFKTNTFLRQEWLEAKKATYYNWNYEIQTDSTPLKSQMVGCLLKNGSKQTILIGAHIDHLGFKNELDSLGKRLYYNGADDNASGVAVLLALQNEFALKKLKVNILFVIYTGHENGLHGSEYISAHLPPTAKNVVYTINLDKLGGMDSINPELFIASNDSSFEKMKELQAPFKLVQLDSTTLNLTDTKAFVKKGIPSISISTGDKEYHKTLVDEASIVNIKGMLAVEEFLKQWITKKFSN